MAVATVEKWAPYGVYLNLRAEDLEVTRTSATQFKVKVKVSWTSSGTWWHMKAVSGGATCVLYDGNGASKGTSGTLTGTYTTDTKNNATSETISIVFHNIDPDKASNYKTKTLNLTVSVPKWTSYTVAYNANGGSGAPASQTKWHDEILTLRSTIPTRAHYSFQGWGLTKALADAGTWYYKAGATCGKNENLTLYAVWKANNYTITYNANGGSNAPSAYTQAYDKTFTITTSRPTRANYNFLGWSTSSTATTADSKYDPGDTLAIKSITKNITLYAVWELAYTKPIISNCSIRRVKVEKDSEGNDIVTALDDNSVTVALDYTVECDQLGHAETDEYVTATLTWVPREAESDSFIRLHTSKATVTNVILPFSFDTETTYTFTMTIEDGTGSSTVVKTLSGSKFPIDILREGKGIAFNKPAELVGVADFGFQVCHNAGLLYPVLPENANIDEYRTPNSYAGSNANNMGYCTADPNNASSTVPIGNVLSELGNSTFTLEVISMGADGQVLQRITRCYKTKPTTYERIYYSNSWGEWTGGWIDADLNVKCDHKDDEGDIIETIEQHFIPYGSTESAQNSYKPKYRKDGRTVEIRGAVAVRDTGGLTGGTDNHHIFRLPDGYRPDSPLYVMCQGTGTCTWMLRVGNDGWVDFSRYRNGDAWANAVSNTGTTERDYNATWLPFHVTYLV